MKYAVISERGHIRRIFDEANPRTTEISDSLAADAQALLDAKDRPILFEGAITSRKTEHAAGNQFRWDEDAGTFVRSPMPPPQVVSRRGLRKALLTIGITFDHVRVAVEKEPDEEAKGKALIDLEDAQTFRRDHPLVVAMGDALDKDATEVDALFVLAAKLER